MTTFGISMVKDEADVVEFTVSRMLKQVDHVLVADNGSTDGTRGILEGLGLEILDDPETGYFQSAKMSKLAQEARTRGAEWVVPFDADEVWLPREGARIADLLGSLDPDALIAEAVIFDHVATDAPGLSPWRRTEALPLRKVACRVREGLTIHQGNHGATFDSIRHPLTLTGLLEIRHFPYRSAEQMIRKARNGAAAYAATNLPEDAGKHWRDYGKLSDEQLREVFARYFSTTNPEADPAFVFDPCP